MKEINENVRDIDSSEDDSKISKRGIVKTIKMALKEGMMNFKQANQIKLEAGITKAFFTKKQINKKKRKQKIKAQKAARKKQRK